MGRRQPPAPPSKKPSLPPKPLYRPAPAAAPQPSNPPPSTVGWPATAGEAVGAVTGPDIPQAKKAAAATKSQFKGGKARDRSDKKAPPKKRGR